MTPHRSRANMFALTAAALGSLAVGRLSAQRLISIDNTTSPAQVVSIEIAGAQLNIETLAVLPFTITNPIVDEDFTSITVVDGRLHVLAAEPNPARLWIVDASGSVTGGSPITITSPASNPVNNVEGTSTRGGQIVVSYAENGFPTTDLGVLDTMTGQITQDLALAPPVLDADAMTILSDGTRIILDRLTTSSTSAVYSVDATTGTATLVGSLPSASNTALASVLGDRIFALDRGGQRIVEIDRLGNQLQDWPYGNRELTGLEAADLLAPAQPPAFYSIDSNTDRLQVLRNLSANSLTAETRGIVLSAAPSITNLNAQISLETVGTDLFLLESTDGAFTRTDPVQLQLLSPFGQVIAAAPVRSSTGADVLNAEGLARLGGSLRLSYSPTGNAFANAVGVTSFSSSSANGDLAPPTIFVGDGDALAFAPDGTQWFLDRFQPSGASSLNFVDSSGTSQRPGAFPGTSYTDLTYADNGRFYALNRGTREVQQLDWRGGIVARYSYSSSLDLTGLAEFRETPSSPLGTSFRVSTNNLSTEDSRRPATASLSNVPGIGDIYLAVWERDVTGNQDRVTGRLYGSDGMPIGVPANSTGAEFDIVNSGSGQISEIRVAAVESTNRFVISFVWQGNLRAYSLDPLAPLANNMPPKVGFPRPVLTTNIIASGVQAQADLGGATNDSTNAIAVYGSNNGNLRARLIDSVTGDTVPGSGAVTFSANGQAPRISSHGGEAGRYLVAWESAAAGPDDISAVFLDETGNPIGSIFEASDATSTFWDESPDVDGDGEFFAVVYDTRQFLDNSTKRVAIRGIGFTPSGPSFTPAEQLVGPGGSNTEEEEPVVAFADASAIVAFERKTNDGFSDCYVASVNLFNHSPCVDPILLSPSTSGTQDQLAITRGDGRRAMVLLRDQISGADNIWGHMFEPRDGRIRRLGGACGAQPGRTYASCTTVGNFTAQQFLVGSLPNAPAALLLNSLQNTFPCGPCRFIPNLATGITVGGMVDGQGSAAITLSVPNNGSLVGMPWYSQWIVAGGTSCLGLVDLSDGIEFTIE